MLINNNNIYFIENIISTRESNENSNFHIAALLRVSERFNLNAENEILDFRLIELNNNQKSSFHEGQFVFLNNGTLSNANSTPIAKRNMYLNNLYRGRLLNQIETSNESDELYVDAKIYSYHINVGHGNCSIIVIEQNDKTTLWLVDCSNYDMINRTSYQSNIDLCLQNIKTKFHLPELVFDKCFITHTHFDHYSGIRNLIDNKFLNKSTEFYLNLHYSMPSETLTKLLIKISQLKSKVIEPISINSIDKIQIWYPLKRTIRTKTIKYKDQDVEVEPSPNNSSAVFYLKFGSKSILFPGDIETAGWNKINKCSNHLQDSNYFAVSHHGSINGHLRTLCPVRRNISNLSDCVLGNSTQILMGRNNAFSGIYSNQVINDFPNIIYTEKDLFGHNAKYLEIDWQTNNKNHFA